MSPRTYTAEKIRKQFKKMKYLIPYVNFHYFWERADELNRFEMRMPFRSRRDGNKCRDTIWIKTVCN